jgi:hypothetical protein
MLHCRGRRIVQRRRRRVPCNERLGGEPMTLRMHKHGHNLLYLRAEGSRPCRGREVSDTSHDD